LNHAASGLAYFLDLRVYDHGVAFRYEFTDAADKNITAESSGFVIPAGSTVWGDTNTDNYERYYVPMDISAWPANLNLGPPVTIQLAGTNGFLALTESTLGAFGNSFLRKVPDATDRLLQVGYPVNQDGTTGVATSGAVNTPWNVIMIGADLNPIMNNDLVESLAPPPDPALFPEGTATAWATAGRSSPTRPTVIEPCARCATTARCRSRSTRSSDTATGSTICRPAFCSPSCPTSTTGTRLAAGPRAGTTNCWPASPGPPRSAPATTWSMCTTCT
jgi:hypothetical protein